MISEQLVYVTAPTEGRLRPETSAVDLLQAVFPGGSITGAPKIRAMEIIAELEPTRRGPYCGCVGYIGFDGNMDTRITIRTYAIKNNVVTFQAGGGIVADSSPTDEYEETLTKAKVLMEALHSAVIYYVTVFCRELWPSRRLPWSVAVADTPRHSR